MRTIIAGPTKAVERARTESQSPTAILPLWTHRSIQRNSPEELGPDHPHFYHRDHRNCPPVPLELIPPNAEAALPILGTLPKVRQNNWRDRITAVERLLATEQSNFKAHTQAYQRMLERDTPAVRRQLRPSQESTRCEALAATYRQVSADLGRVVLLTGMLRRLVE